MDLPDDLPVPSTSRPLLPRSRTTSIARSEREMSRSHPKSRSGSAKSSLSRSDSRTQSRTHSRADSRSFNIDVDTDPSRPNSRNSSRSYPASRRSSGRAQRGGGGDHETYMNEDPARSTSLSTPLSGSGSGIGNHQNRTGLPASSRSNPGDVLETSSDVEHGSPVEAEGSGRQGLKRKRDESVDPIGSAQGTLTSFSFEDQHLPSGSSFNSSGWSFLPDTQAGGDTETDAMASTTDRSEDEHFKAIGTNSERASTSSPPPEDHKGNGKAKAKGKAKATAKSPRQTRSRTRKDDHKGKGKARSHPSPPESSSSPPVILVEDSPPQRTIKRPLTMDDEGDELIQSDDADADGEVEFIAFSNDKGKQKAKAPSPPTDHLLASYTCPICFYPPTNATLAPCGHILCGACLFQAVHTSIANQAMGVGGNRNGEVPPGAPRPEARCPVCRAIIRGWDGKGGGVIGLKIRSFFSM